MLKLFTDTDTDITPEIARKYGYSVISMPYSTEDETVWPYSGSDTFDFHSFYDTLRNGAMPTTSAISEDVYTDYFEPVFAAGDDILYVHFSAAMTATFGNMEKSVEYLTGKYPDRKFYHIDTKGITTISLSIVMEIGDLYLEGKSIGEIMDAAPEIIDHTAQYFFADDLKFFRRSGRVGGLAATMGGLLGVRPIIYMSAEGKMESLGTERGRPHAMNRLISYVEELGYEIDRHRIFIGHTDAPELAKELEEKLREKFSGRELTVITVPVNPTAGSHCGPDGVGIIFHAKHR